MFQVLLCYQPQLVLAELSLSVQVPIKKPGKIHQRTAATSTTTWFFQKCEEVGNLAIPLLSLGQCRIKNTFYHSDPPFGCPFLFPSRMRPLFLKAGVLGGSNFRPDWRIQVGRHTCLFLVTFARFTKRSNARLLTNCASFPTSYRIKSCSDIRYHHFMSQWLLLVAKVSWLRYYRPLLERIAWKSKLPKQTAWFWWHVYQLLTCLL